MALQDENWKSAMHAEYEALLRNKTWSLVPLPSSQKLIGCKWVFRLKLKPNGDIDRYKARLVAQGYTQAYGLDYFETFSPVVKPETIRIVLSLAVSFNKPIRQLDVHNAFLHGDLMEEVYMKQPTGSESTSYPNQVLKLHKALYGLKQSPRVWFSNLSSCLLEWGLIASMADSSMFVLKSGLQVVIFLIYVDDILVTGNSLSFIQHYISALHDRFSLKDMGELSYFLGIQVVRTKDGLHLS